ncbi:hypothetical protein V8G54_028276 [Vigna mungo]|uniref:Uncharacterized protein n=1 Tax=Vigna mungo TaxID=3915 RepID=A0AAQ3MS32_VIGMU
MRPKCNRNRCNCFNTNSSNEDDFDLFSAPPPPESSTTDATESLKTLIPCASVSKRNLLTDVAKIMGKNDNFFKRKNDLIKVVGKALSSTLGYDSSIYKLKWEKTLSCPAAEYEFIDAIVEGERLIMDVDLRSEFEVVRSTGSYKAILQSLSFIFVGKFERLKQIVAIVSKVAKHSLKKKGMHVLPWRKHNYMLTKWFSPSSVREKQPHSPSCKSFESPPKNETESKADSDKEKAELPSPTTAWQPSMVKPKSVERRAGLDD